MPFHQRSQQACEDRLCGAERRADPGRELGGSALINGGQACQPEGTADLKAGSHSGCGNPARVPSSGCCRRKASVGVQRDHIQQERQGPPRALTKRGWPTCEQAEQTEQGAGHTQLTQRGQGFGSPDAGHWHSSRLPGGSLWGSGSFLNIQQAESMPHLRLEPEGSQPQVETTVAHGRMLSWKGW